jgi:PAS domain S-box-containing protein
MNEKIKSLFISFHTWQIVLFSMLGAILITNLVTALVSLWMWGKIQTEVLILGTINAVLVPLILLPLVIRSVRRTLQLEEQNQVQIETISRLENQSQMEPAAQWRADEMSLLYQLGILLAAGKNLYDTLLIFQSEIVKLAEVDTLYVAIYDEATDIVDFPIFFRRGIPQPHESRKLGERPGLTGGVIYSNKTLYLPDMLAEAVIAQYAPVRDSELVLRTFLGIPLVVNEKVIGILSVQSIKVDAYSKDQIQLLENVAVQAATAIDKASLLDQLKKELKEREYVETQLREREVILEAVTFAAEQFLKSPDWRANINLVLERLGKTLGVTHAYLFEDHLDAQGELVTSMQYEWTAPGYTSDLDAPYFQNSKVYQEGYEEQVEALRRGDVRAGTSSTFSSIEKEAMDSFGVKAILEVPVFINEKEWGAIGFDDLVREREWSSAEVEALKIAAGVLSAAIQRQEAESAVRESERIYRRAIEAADAVPYYLDYKSDGYPFMGEGILEMTGYRAEEMRPQTWSELVLETIMLDEAAEFSAAEAIEAVRQGRIKAWKCDQRIRTRDGRIRWLTDRSVELLDERGISNGSIGILQDITNRKLVEANLRQREAMLEAITFAAEQFLKVSDWRTNIDNVLERLGRTMDATHAYLFENHFREDGTEVSTLTFEWTAPGFPSYLDNPIYPNTHALWEGADSIDGHLTKGEAFVGNSSDFPDVEKERFGQLGIRAIVEVPLFVNGAWWGTIGFDDMVLERNWSPPEVDALKIAAGVLGAAIQRQEAESAVHESERIYRQAIESAGAVPYYRDYRENRYTFMGSEIETIIGYKPEEVTMDLWLNIMKENIPLGGGRGLNIHEAVQQARTGALKVWRSDMRVIAKNGEERWVTDSAVELFDDSPVSYASIGILQDITERKKTEVNLRKRESILEAITFAAEQFLKASNWREQINAVLERLGGEFNASHAYLFERHRGPNNEILSSMTYEWTVPEGVSDLGKPAFQNLPLQSMGFERMYEILDRGDPLIGSASFFNEAEREYLSSINVKALLEMRISVDGQQWGTIGFDDVIHEREWTPMEVDVIRVASNVLGAAIKRQNDEAALQKELDERQRLIDELELRNAESETLRETTVIVTSTLDVTEAVKRILEQLKRVLAYDSASVWLYKGNIANLVGEDGLPEMAESDKTYVVDESEPDYPLWVQSAPYVLLEDVQAEYAPFRQPPFDYIRAWLSIPLRVRGRLIGFISLDGRRPGQFDERDAKLALTYANQVSIALENARLFSDLQSQLKERQKLIGELENKNSELERFTYTVSHDLKSPLVTINGFLGYLEQDAASGNTNRMKGDIQRIHEAVKKMQNLLNELLELSRIGRVVNPPMKVSFNDLVREAILLVGGRLEARQANVIVQPNLPVVNVDKPRIVEVLQNLLDNAAKYMGDQAEPQIEIGQRGGQAGHPVFYVRDNGIGIEPQFHERVFGLFNKLDPNSEGTGVGLALVKRIIEIHGGQIWVESETGRGSTFLFTLPPAPQPKPDSVI